MERTKKDSKYFSAFNLVCHYLELEKELIQPTLEEDLLYLEDNNLSQNYYEAYNILYNLAWYLKTDGKTIPASLIDQITAPIEIDVVDVLKRLYNKYRS